MFLKTKWNNGEKIFSACALCDVSQIFKHQLHIFPPHSANPFQLSLFIWLCFLCRKSLHMLYSFNFIKKKMVFADYNGLKRRYTACNNPQLKCKYFNFSDYSLILCYVCYTLQNVSEPSAPHFKLRTTISPSYNSMLWDNVRK